MKTAGDLDLVIISDLGGYRNFAFPFSFANLVHEGQLMTVQALQRLITGPSAPGEGRPVSLEETGKLNGLFLYDFCRAQGLSCALLDSVDGERLEGALARGPRCVALSTTWTPSPKDVRGVVDAIRALDGEVPIVVGGPLVWNSALLHRRLEDPEYDTASAEGDYYFLDDGESARGIDWFVVSERGEGTLAALVRAIKEGRDPSGLANLAFYREGELRFTAQDEAAAGSGDHILRWDLLDEELLPAVAPVQLTSGCPYRCRYCNFSGHRRRRTPSREAIRQELGYLASRRGVRFLRFVDDSMSRRAMADLCEVFLIDGIELPWSSMVRADALEPRLVAMAKAAGCHSFHLGLESADDGVLKAMNKKATVARHLEALELLDRAEINARLYFMLGFPGETAGSVERLIEFLGRLPSEGDATVEYAVAPFLLLPLSPVYEGRARRELGLEGYMGRWRHRTMSSREALEAIHEVFLRARSKAVWGYPGDALALPGVSARGLKEIKLAREGLQRSLVRGDHSLVTEGYWALLREAFGLGRGESLVQDGGFRTA